MLCELELEECGSKELLACGLHQEWVSASADGVEADMTAGVGLGNPWLQMRIRDKGVTRCFRVNMANFFQKVIIRVVEENETNGDAAESGEDRAQRE